jgi:peroxiredoxin
MLNHALRKSSLAGWCLGASVLCLGVLTGGCSKSNSGGEGTKAPKYEVADDTARGAKATQPDTLPSFTDDAAPATGGKPAADSDTPAANSLRQPPSIPGDQLDTVTVPQGTPAELLKFISQLGDKALSVQMQIQQGNATPAAMQPILEAMLEASDKVLAAEIDDVTRKRAIEAKAGALTMLSQLAPDRPWGDQIREFAKSLAADKSPAIAIEGRTILLGILVGEVASGRSKDVDGLTAQLKSLLADDQRNFSVLNVTQQACMALREAGREDEARETFGLIANAFKDNPDPELAAEADNMLEQLLVMDLKIESKLKEVVLKREGAVAALTDAITQVLQRPSPGMIALDRILRCLPLLEQSGNYELAGKVCEMIQAAYKNSTSPEIREYAKQKTDMMMRRLNLVGKPLSLEGNLLDGSPLDFAPYQGKVVLLAFWSSAAPSCRPELLSVKTVYEKYHAQGFEVIGVCLDQDIKAATRFLSDTQLPWTTITNDKLVEQFGVEMIPYLLLTDRQGNIVDLFVLGSALDAKLASLLGAATSTTPPVAGGQ